MYINCRKLVEIMKLRTFKDKNGSVKMKIEKTKKYYAQFKFKVLEKGLGDFR